MNKKEIEKKQTIGDLIKDSKTSRLMEIETQLTELQKQTRTIQDQIIELKLELTRMRKIK